MSCVVSFIRGKKHFDLEYNYSFTTYSLKQYTSLRVIIITALASCRSTCIWSITYASDRLRSFIKPTQDDIIKGAREGILIFRLLYLHVHVTKHVADVNIRHFI